MLLEIKTEQGALDLPEGADRDFYITKQLRDVHNLDTREGDYSKTLQLPYTPNNIRLIGAQTPLLTRHKDIGTQFISVEVTMSGFPVIDGAIMRVESGDNEHFTATLFGGVVGFFVQLSEEPIRNLDWSGANYNFDWTAAELQARKNVASGDDNVVFPNANWYTNQSIRLLRSKGGTDTASGINDIQLPLSGFFMYVDTVMRKITNGLQGIIVDYADLEKQDRYNILAFANKMPQLRDNYQDSAGGRFSGDAGATLPTLFGQLDFKSLLVVGATQGALTMINNEWVIPSRGLVTSLITIRGSAGTPPDATISVMKNDDLLRSYLYNQVGGGFVIQDTFSYQAEANDRVWVRVQTRGTAGLAMASNFGTGLQMLRQTGEASIVISNFLPDISQRDFVRAVLNMFNMIAVQKEGQVTFKSWDEIPQQEPLELELDLEINPIESGIWEGYARRNFVKYTANPLVERQDQNAFFDIRVANTEDEIDKIELPFTAIDNTEAEIGNGQLIRAGVPTITIDYVSLETQITFGPDGFFTTAENHGLRLGDILIVSGAFSRVVAITNGKAGQTQITLNSSTSFARIRPIEANSSPLHLAVMNQANGNFRIMDGSTISDAAGDFKNAVFDQSLTWPTLLDNYFKNLINAVSNPFRLVAWFDISILQYINIDQTRPVYLPSYGALFYINIIEQYKSVGNVRIELLQVGSATNLVADAQGLQVGAFDDSFSNDFDNYNINEI